MNADRSAADMTQRQKLSVVIPCKDEERNILQCIASVGEVADEIVVADSGSVDQTLEKVRQQGDCRIVQREFVSYSSFKSWAILQATHRWVLTLDADERLTPAAAKEIRTLLASEPPCDGYKIRRVNHCLGHPLRHGPARRDWPLRLFRGDLASYNDCRVHESIQLVSDRVGKLREPMIHFAYWSIADYARKGQLYADLAAEDLHITGRRTGFFKLLSAWPVRFFKCYVLQRGFLDGVPGLVHSLLSASYTMNKYLSLWSLSKQSQREQIDPEPVYDAKQVAA